ncbi:MAG TPA: hypothetical protein VK714_07160 [Myxococcota bacterium]|nr:hypothetical protein [Myxococcota bacterium]
MEPTPENELIVGPNPLTTPCAVSGGVIVHTSSRLVVEGGTPTWARFVAADGKALLAVDGGENRAIAVTDEDERRELEAGESSALGEFKIKL